jgi:hypothetical protein
MTSSPPQWALPAALVESGDPSRNEIVQAPVIARRRSDRCEGSALLRNRFDAHDAEKLVEPSPSVGGLFHFKPSLQCRLLAFFGPHCSSQCPLRADCVEKLSC